MYKCSSSKLSKFDHPEIWKHTSVSNIIKNRVYTGDLIQHGFQKVSYKVKKRKSLPESEWCIKENSHETLIDKKTFEIAQSIKDGKLSDVASTLLTLLDKKVQKEMTGTILINK